MDVIHYSESMPPVTSSVVTVGTFDGVHLGHGSVLKYLVNSAKPERGISTVVTFDPHPREVVRGEKVTLLSSISERAARCKLYGVDRFVVIPFTREFASLTAEEFVTDVLSRRIGLSKIIVGHDHAFGKDRRGGRRIAQKARGGS